ncbi:phosphoglycerate dehydrogenase [Aestuariirhabdus sp. LZHN29]|uniref:phosphoglycerate dehydrogenase n=1 Tax=Aestuariirhabdus sp. LZHN29 TaxID=3417462 RepID=UPI003CF39486
MHKIRTYNQISALGLDRFSRSLYEVASEITHPDAFLLRSQNLHSIELPDTLQAIARAGAGVNNVPTERCSEQGIVVFNTPGANANAVKELVLTGLLLSSRGVSEGLAFVQSLDANQPADEMAAYLEAQKKRFAGSEIAGKTLGVVGLGAIGSMVANMALSLGMDVVGYDPAISVEAAWRLSSKVGKMDNLHSLLARSDFVSLHVPAFEATHHLINSDSLKSAKPGLKLLNFSREEIVDHDAILPALAEGVLAAYVADFPTPNLIGKAGVLLLPHIGASTREAEENCAVMAAEQLIDYLENGNVKNSVNFPNIRMDRAGGSRITFSNHNVSGVLGDVLSVLAERKVNVLDMLNKSRNELAYNIIDVEGSATEDLVAAISALEHVIKVRVI